MTSYFKTQECRDKSIEACLDKYGVKYTFLNEEVREKAKKKYRDKCYNPHPGHIGYTEEGLWIMQCPHPNCNKCEEKTKEPSTTESEEKSYEQQTLFPSTNMY